MTSGHQSGVVSPFRAFDEWLSRHRVFAISLIILVSLALRVVYFGEINSTPCVWLHRWDQTDMNFFDLWARQVAAGDILQDHPFHPYHQLYREEAEAYLSTHPVELARLQRELPSPGYEPGHALWDRWMGGKRFQQEPLYTYLIALTYRLFSPDVRWVFAWQSLLGILTNVLVYLVARRMFGDLVAVVSALFTVACGTLLFFEMVLLRASPLTFITMALAYLLLLTLERGTRKWWFATGLGFGLAILFKVIFIPFLLGAWLVAAILGEDFRQVVLKITAPLVAGLALAFVPLVARNIAVGLEPWSLTSANAYTFITSNAEDYRPEYGYTISRHLLDIMANSDGRAFPAAILTLKTHASIMSYLNLLWRKFAVVWHWYERPNNANFYYYRLHVAVLRYLPVTFFIIAPLALVGIAISIPRIRAVWPMYILIAALIVSMLLSIVLSRYRLPLVATVIPFAGLAVVRIAEWLAGNQRLKAVVAIAALILVSTWTMRPLPPDISLINASDYGGAYFASYSIEALKAISVNNWRGAADVIAGSLQYEPDVVRAMASGDKPRNAEESRLAELFSQVHQRYADALRKAGMAGDAAVQEERAKLLKVAAGSRIN